jgi:signal transduction histidine kinase
MAPPSQRRGGRPKPIDRPDTPHVGHVYLDARRRLLYCLNETARELQADGVPFTGPDLARQPLQQMTGEAVTPAEMPLSAAWANGRPSEATFVLIRRGGAVQYLHWTAAPLRDAHGQVQAVVGSVSVRPPEPDWQGLAGLAHDLRNPLQALRMSAEELVLGQALPADAREAVERMRRASERALSVGQDLLEWCRGPATGGRRVADSWLTLESYLISLIEEETAAAARKGLTLAHDLAPVRGWQMSTDRVRLGRLLANLLSNAVRYTPSGRVQFTASWVQETSGRSLCLEVVDTGAGISPEEQESIFQPFERGKAAKGDSSGGSGLGLAVVDRLVEELRLTIAVASEHGRGSTFRLFIPATMLRRVPA